MTEGGPNPASLGVAEEGEALVELSSRLVYSLLRAAIRVAARFNMPLARLVQLTRVAYFAELRESNPRDLSGIAKKLGISLRTAGSINKNFRDDFFKPENEVQPMRRVTAQLLHGPQTLDQIAAATGLEREETERVVQVLRGHGWLDGEGDTVALTTELRSFVTADTLRRVDGLNNQMDVLADSVWSRFVTPSDDPAGARTWVFAARPDQFAAFMDKTVHAMRHGAVDLEEEALTDDDYDRYAITLAFAPVKEEG